MHPMFPIAMISVAAGVGLIVTAVFLHAREMSRRLPAPPRRRWWEGCRPNDKVPLEEIDQEPRPKRAAADAPATSTTPAHRREFNPGRFA